MFKVCFPNQSLFHVLDFVLKFLNLFLQLSVLVLKVSYFPLIFFKCDFIIIGSCLDYFILALKVL